jgi:hypothetical protein
MISTLAAMPAARRTEAVVQLDFVPNFSSQDASCMMPIGGIRLPAREIGWPERN